MPRFFRSPQTRVGGRLFALTLSLFMIWSQAGGSCDHVTDAGAGVVIDEVDLSGSVANPTVGVAFHVDVTTFVQGSNNSAGGITFTWTSSDATVLQITQPTDPAATLVTVTPLKVGTATITVTTADLKGATTVTGVPMSASQTFTVAAAGAGLSIATDSPLPTAVVGATYSHPLTSSGGPASVSTVAWTVTSGALPAGFTLNSSTGVLSSGAVSSAPGTYNFTVQVSVTPTGGGAAVTATKAFALTVNALVFTSLTVIPSGAADLFTPNTRQYSVITNTGLDVSGIATWSSSSPGVALVSSTGFVTTIAGGSTTISATVNGVTASTPLVVHSVATVAVTPAHSLVAIGTQVSFVANVYDQNGVDVTSQVPPTWTNSNAAVATMTASGATANVTPIANGGALFTATAGGRSGAGGITVGTTAGAIQFNLISKATATGPLAVGAQLTALQGTTVAGRGVATCVAFSTTSNVCTSLRGYIVGLAPGTYTVQVSLLGYATQTVTGVVVTGGQVTSAAQVVLTAAPPASMTIAPNGTVTIAKEGSRAFTVTLLDAGGNPTAIEAGSSIGFLIDDSPIADVTPTADPYTFIVIAKKLTGTTTARAFYVRNGAQTNIIASATISVQ